LIADRWQIGMANLDDPIVYALNFGYHISFDDEITTGQSFDKKTPMLYAYI
jgi:hypothetical protein